jgi:hypothetical protein
VTGGFFDTQCGLKGLRGDVADALFPILRVDRFAFDVELVYVALKHRLDIKRIPVRLVHNETSSVRLLRDATRGAVDVFRIKASQLGGRYDAPALDDIVRGLRSGARRRARTSRHRVVDGARRQVAVGASSPFPDRHLLLKAAQSLGRGEGGSTALGAAPCSGWPVLLFFRFFGAAG